jgi:ferredoxin--NADP+ reductase
MVKGHNHHVRPVRLSFQEELSPGRFLLGFHRDFDFRAGQVIGISLAEDGARRLYSICSGEREEEVQILYNVVDEGYLTPRLADAEVGDILWITEARGEFTCDEEEAVWIAAGTGIAPFYSMLRSGLGEGKLLLHGERYLEQYHFHDDFRATLGQDYLRCCSAEAGEGIYHGRVSDWLREHPLPATGLKYYLCGSAEMVVDTRDILIELGIPFDHIVSEIYF